ncbi:hypothetical protein IE81DRAFT_176804 [Ceraceosorus guamensis]|uniref:Uncharacterized protein n=1 Tax=Ceraceosorus guamensis TaxID=1522189 RepID=A0A316VV07_9BASI|nr:hypothetical protein IE81DRAFT_176804 [Ceraceosorus guamensis]PWN41447.1 hypothetical protein IE81DRAFT_176804 [Ceraceosorus guamensis]
MRAHLLLYVAAAQCATAAAEWSLDRHDSHIASERTIDDGLSTCFGCLRRRGAGEDAVSKSLKLIESTSSKASPAYRTRVQHERNRKEAMAKKLKSKPVSKLSADEVELLYRAGHANRVPLGSGNRRTLYSQHKILRAQGLLDRALEVHPKLRSLTRVDGQRIDTSAPAERGYGPYKSRSANLSRDLEPARGRPRLPTGRGSSKTRQRQRQRLAIVSDQAPESRDGASTAHASSSRAASPPHTPLQQNTHPAHVLFRPAWHVNTIRKARTPRYEVLDAASSRGSLQGEPAFAAQLTKRGQQMNEEALNEAKAVYELVQEASRRHRPDNPGRTAKDFGEGGERTLLRQMRIVKQAQKSGLADELKEFHRGHKDFLEPGLSWKARRRTTLARWKVRSILREAGSLPQHVWQVVPGSRSASRYKAERPSPAKLSSAQNSWYEWRDRKAAEVKEHGLAAIAPQLEKLHWDNEPSSDAERSLFQRAHALATARAIGKHVDASTSMSSVSGPAALATNRPRRQARKRPWVDPDQDDASSDAGDHLPPALRDVKRVIKSADALRPLSARWQVKKSRSKGRDDRTALAASKVDHAAPSYARPGFGIAQIEGSSPPVSRQAQSSASSPQSKAKRPRSQVTYVDPNESQARRLQKRAPPEPEAFEKAAAAYDAWRSRTKKHGPKPMALGQGCRKTISRQRKRLAGLDAACHVAEVLPDGRSRLSESQMTDERLQRHRLLRAAADRRYRDRKALRLANYSEDDVWKKVPGNRSMGRLGAHMKDASSPYAAATLKAYGSTVRKAQRIREQGLAEGDLLSVGAKAAKTGRPSLAYSSAVDSGAPRSSIAAAPRTSRVAAPPQVESGESWLRKSSSEREASALAPKFNAGRKKNVLGVGSQSTLWRQRQEGALPADQEMSRAKRGRPKLPDGIGAPITLWRQRQRARVEEGEAESIDKLPSRRQHSGKAPLPWGKGNHSTLTRQRTALRIGGFNNDAIHLLVPWKYPERQKEVENFVPAFKGTSNSGAYRHELLLREGSRLREKGLYEGSERLKALVGQARKWRASRDQPLGDISAPRPPQDPPTTSVEQSTYTAPSPREPQHRRTPRKPGPVLQYDTTFPKPWAAPSSARSSAAETASSNVAEEPALQKRSGEEELLKAKEEAQALLKGKFADVPIGTGQPKVQYGHRETLKNAQRFDLVEKIWPGMKRRGPARKAVGEGSRRTLWRQKQRLAREGQSTDEVDSLLPEPRMNYHNGLRGFGQGSARTLSRQRRLLRWGKVPSDKVWGIVPAKRPREPTASPEAFSGRDVSLRKEAESIRDHGLVHGTSRLLLSILGKPKLSSTAPSSLVRGPSLVRGDSDVREQSLASDRE